MQCAYLLPGSINIIIILLIIAFVYRGIHLAIINHGQEAAIGNFSQVRAIRPDGE